MAWEEEGQQKEGRDQTRRIGEEDEEETEGEEHIREENETEGKRSNE